MVTIYDRGAYHLIQKDALLNRLVVTTLSGDVVAGPYTTPSDAVMEMLRRDREHQQKIGQTGLFDATK